MRRAWKAAAVIAAVVALAFVWAFSTGLLVLDHSATRVGEGFRWKGNLYIPCSFDCAEGRTIAMTDDGWRINAVEEDDSRTFLVLRSFLDEYTCVREDYVIPREGTLTALFWDGHRYDDPELVAVIAVAMADFSPEMTVTDDHIESITDNRHLNSLRFCYEGCPVGVSVAPGYHFGLLDDRWVLARRAAGQTPEYGVPMIYEIYPIPETASAILAPYRDALR